MYLMETHAHTKGVSMCASATPEQVVAAYKAAGYSGIVSTNHINLATFSRLEDASWPDKVDHFMTGYEAMKQAAGDDLDVLLGCEVNLSRMGEDYISNDYLIYGVTREWLLSSGDLRKCSLRELSQKARAAGMLIVQAHPFRYGCILVDEGLLDGVEIFNAHAHHDSHNDMAEHWANKFHLIKTSGSDYHDPDSVIGGGLLTRTRIRDNNALLELLRSGCYKTLRGD